MYSCSLFTSAAKTTSAGATESIQFALMDITACPPCFRNCSAFTPTMRAWSFWATSEKMTSTSGRSMRYLFGCRASSTIAIHERTVNQREVAQSEYSRMMFVRFLAMFTRSRPDLTENSTAYTNPSCWKHIK